jgi:LPS-assembly lipoprotein
MRRWAILLLSAFIIASVSACGFKLKGPTQLSFTKLYTDFAEGSLVGVDFRRLLRAQGSVEIVSKPELGDVRLMILQDARERETVGYSATGRPREYQLRQKLRYQILDNKANPVGDVVEIVIRRDISTSEALINAKQQEEEQLYRDMQDDLVQQLVRRLASINLKQLPDANSRR